MALGDFIRRFFAKKANPGLDAAEVFARTHKGVEGYIEPLTSTQPTTLLLVDREGDHLRSPVREPEDAVAFCERLGLPVYDAQVIGYPKRMIDRGRGTANLDEQFADLEKRLSETDPDIPDN